VAVLIGRTMGLARLSVRPLRSSSKLKQKAQRKTK